MLAIEIEIADDADRIRVGSNSLAVSVNGALEDVIKDFITSGVGGDKTFGDTLDNTSNDVEVGNGVGSVVLNALEGIGEWKLNGGTIGDSGSNRTSITDDLNDDCTDRLY